MFKSKCRNGENCKYHQQGVCKYLHNEYKDIEIKNNPDEFMLSKESFSLLLDIKEKNKPFLYIRHAEKEYKNGKNEEFSLDPDITEEGKISAFNKFKLLFATYGAPERIITSPYLRTRTTAEMARSVIFEQTNIYIEIEYDNQLGECLKNQKDKDLDICLRPETLIHNPIPSESLKQYNNRIYAHTKKSQYNTWYITHGFNIYTIASIKKCKIKYPAELCGIMIENDGKITCI
jgi:phosphohistidine phosphatase SixA